MPNYLDKHGLTDRHKVRKVGSDKLMNESFLEFG